MSLNTKQSEEVGYARRGIVLCKVPPEADGAEPHAEASSMFGALIEVDPQRVEREGGPQGRVRAAVGRVSPPPIQTHAVHSPQPEPEERRGDDHGRPHRDSEHLEPPLARDARRHEATR